MKLIYSLAIGIAIFSPLPTYAKEIAMTDKNLHFPLKKPLLIMTAKRGFLACGYINVETCNKTGEACAIVTGVSNYDDMQAAKIVSVSDMAAELGIGPGMSGADALNIFNGK